MGQTARTTKLLLDLRTQDQGGANQGKRSQYCSRCGAKGMRFSLVAGQRITGNGGKLFFCSTCHYECQADFNASANVHHSFFREYHWQPRVQKSG